MLRSLVGSEMCIRDSLCSTDHLEQCRAGRSSTIRQADYLSGKAGRTDRFFCLSAQRLLRRRHQHRSGGWKNMSALQVGNTPPDCDMLSTAADLNHSCACLSIDRCEVNRLISSVRGIAKEPAASQFNQRLIARKHMFAGTPVFVDNLSLIHI